MPGIMQDANAFGVEEDISYRSVGNVLVLKTIGRK